MKISLNWLKDYLTKLDIESMDTLTKKMVSIGLDIEGIEDEGKVFEKFVIGEVIEKEKHPNADKLSLCKVNVGDKILSIVCGAPNVGKGQKVCVALEKAIIPNGNFEIKKSKIRGELSEGMICSEKELNISENHEGILVLNGEATTGQSFAEYMNVNDVVFDIGITPNRGDLFSHFGVGREVGAIYDKKISFPEIKIIESKIPTNELIKIRIDNPLCKRFTVRVIKNVQIKESPQWLRKRLTSIGLKPKNNIVDITNFVMFETGQPLHAFDYDKIRGKEIIVKTAKEGDKFVTLDSKERKLNSESLMICDGEVYSGIAGIMGGKHSEISEETKNIFLEAAYFDPVSIRMNSKRLGLQTDASQRFERGVDINMVEYASLRATQLIQELAGGEVSKDLYDVYPEKFNKIEIGLRAEKANEVIGIEINEDNIIKLLEKIEIMFLRKENDKLIFEIPEFRRLDLEREIDLIEEVARIYGYNNIEGSINFNINVQNSSNYENSNVKIVKEITDHFIGRGFNQILTNSLIEEKKAKVFSENIVKLKNSISIGMDSMRPNLISGMLKAISNNFNNSGKDISLKLFEIGRTFFDEGKMFKEENSLIIGLSGKMDSLLIYGEDKEIDIFYIKGEVEMFLSKLNLENLALFCYNDKHLNSNIIDILLDDKSIGNIYKIDSSLKKDFEIDSEVYIAEFNLDLLFSKAAMVKFYKEISKFPSVKRDIALVVDKKTSYYEVRNLINKSGGDLLRKVILFDQYEDEKLGEDKKSLAFSMEFSSNEKTLTDDETDRAIKNITLSLETNLGATLRK
ncbi:MAG: phenylalanine--tRNA ligase subunit beta [Bacteroidota bacterium]|nr:phenylalanine--tRNA ligase subunit beta [Bacteroidota bacterium]